VSEASAGLAIIYDGTQVVLEITLPDEVAAQRVEVPTTATLGRVRFPNLVFDAPDGSDVRLGTDLVGAVADGPVVPGPIQSLKPGKNRVVVWG